MRKDGQIDRYDTAIGRFSQHEGLAKQRILSSTRRTNWDILLKLSRCRPEQAHGDSVG
jgi:hypothetical protein